jgi:hypothetical protein
MQGFGGKAVRMLGVAAVLACLALGGCLGPTQTVQQGKDLCSAGIQYTEALEKLLDVTIETVIDYDSDELIRQRKYADPNDLRRFLDERNEALIDQVKTLETFRSDGRRLQAYFVSLQGLVDARFQESAAAAVGDLSESINAANESLKKSQHLGLNEKEQAGISQLGGLVAKGVHAEVVKKALRRDAAVIAEQLMLHEKLMGRLRGILEDRYAGQMDVIRNQKIRKPYIAAGEPLSDEWKADRREWIRSSFCLEELSKAAEAIRQMRFIWAGILEGRQNVESVQLALDDIHDFTQAVQALHATGKDRKN